KIAVNLPHVALNEFNLERFALLLGLNGLGQVILREIKANDIEAAVCKFQAMPSNAASQVQDARSGPGLGLLQYLLILTYRTAGRNGIEHCVPHFFIKKTFPLVLFRHSLP